MTITIDGVEHDFDAFTDEQKGMVAHINDLNAKLDQLNFQGAQLAVARDSFVGMLKQSLQKD